MMSPMRLALVPFNPIIGDPRGNAVRIGEHARRAGESGVDLVVFPEMALAGYPPRDLLLRESFLDECAHAARELSLTVGPTPVLVGAPRRANGRVFNSALLLRDGAIDETYDKRLLPNYDVFDEPRYFSPGEHPGVMEIAGTRVGVAICEDLWRARDVGDAAGYDGRPDPVEDLARAGVDLVVCLSASPFVVGKDARQQEILRAASDEIGVPVVSVNQLGANDELIFDGAAHLARPGSPCLSAPRFRERTVELDTSSPASDAPWRDAPSADALSALWDALTLGVRDYAAKTGFSTCVLGLSGGVDSALVCAIASAALGGENVVALSMPSRYSSQGSRDDAREQCERTGVTMHEVPIDPVHRAGESALAGVLGDAPPGVAGENIQARLRGLIVMAYSNAHGALALATGNKSELAVGYCTLYGDMCGGLAPIADLYKTRVYELSRWLNANHQACGFDAPPLPDRVLTKPPSAELRPDQTDQDSLPEYDALDEALIGLIEERLDVDQLVERRGVPIDVARLAARLLHGGEHKRRQMAIGLKVSPTAFGIGRRVQVATHRGADRSAYIPHND